mgnify:FL=1|nr:MAG TPA: hypothetical protein [Caudoviricetes sp.]
MITLKPKSDTSFIPITPNMVEGKDYIAISTISKHKLGRALAIGYTTNFKTVAGNVVSVKRFMEYIGMKDYPTKYLMQSKMKTADIRAVNKLETVDVPNYWAILTYAVCKRIQKDLGVQKMIKENTLPYTIVKWDKIDEELQSIEGDKKCLVNMEKYATYLGIIRDIESLIKSDTFNTETISNLIEYYKRDKNLDLFHGTAVILKEENEM